MTTMVASNGLRLLGIEIHVPIARSTDVTGLSFLDLSRLKGLHFKAPMNVSNRET